MSKTDCGVVKTEAVWTDDFKGSSANLVAAGLVRLDELPGQPGRGMSCVTYDHKGEPKTKGRPRDRTAGARHIRRTGHDRFCVSVTVEDAVGEARLAASNAEWRAHQAREAAIAASAGRSAGQAAIDLEAAFAPTVHVLAGLLSGASAVRRKTIADSFQFFAAEPLSPGWQHEILRLLTMHLVEQVAGVPAARTRGHLRLV